MKAPGEIYWQGLWLLIRYRRPIDDHFIHQGMHYVDTPGYDLPTVLGVQLNRDGTPSDPIIFHANKTLVAGFTSFDSDTIINSTLTIHKRYEKLKRLQPDSINSLASSWFSGN
jgi:hypothetical protein